MAKFFFHLVDSIDVLLDPEGCEMHADQVAGSALSQARSIIAHDAIAGEIDFKYRIEVRDAADALVHGLTFSDAVKIVHYSK